MVRRVGGFRVLVAGLAASLPGLALAADGPTVAGVEVVAAAPLPGSETPVDLIASRVQILSGETLTSAGPAGTLGAVQRRLTGVSLADAQNNPFQPNLIYRGFSASPLGGDAQGLAVYVDGGRFNQPFGDTVDWDLIPDAAISSVTLEGPSPAFGLNALGGALAVRLKTGESDPGGRAKVSGGAFGLVRGQVEAGGAWDGVSGFVALAAAHEDGWRDASPSDVRQAYADLGWSAGRTELHLKLIGADTDLTGNGAAPAELLAARRSAVFTSPDETRNRYLRASLSAAAPLSGGWSLNAEAYAARLAQRTRNGDASDAEPCAAAPGLLCLDDDVLTAGAPIPDTLGGDGYGQLNRTRTTGDAFGASVQLSHAGQVSGRNNRFSAGASFDGGQTRFSAGSLLGALNDARAFQGPGVVIAQADGAVAPVRVRTNNAYVGLYAVETIEVTRALSLTASARLNLARVRLEDRLGTALNGVHHYSRLNPALGATYQLAPGVSAYAGYAETNRAPTPAELSCAGPDRPCSLTNFFVGDPDLKQVVAHTWEAGLRGRWSDGARRLRWTLGGYRTTTRDDLMLIASATRGRGYFQNIGATRRQGIEADVEARTGRLFARAAYAFTDARFRSPLILNSPDNPGADADGLTQVAPDARMPAIPAHRLTLEADYDLTSRLTVGANAILSSGVVLVGDEANLTPRTPGYAVFGLEGSYRLSGRLELYGSISNLTGKDYATFGTFCPTGEVFLAEAPGASDTRCLGPGAPRAVRGGLRARF
jgi:outer membrane receptor protein involved in Fe transport